MTDETELTELQRIGRIRSAATWLKSTSRTIDEYPKRDQLDTNMRSQAQMFANGRLPWPARWTIRLYHAAVDG